MAGRITGLRGSVYMQGSVSKLADTHNWEFTETQEALDCTIKGEPFKRYAASVTSGRIRVQSYVEAGSAPLTGGLMNPNLVTAAGVGTPVTFILWGIDPGTAPGISGQGYIIRSEIHVARDGLITDEMEIEVDGAVTVT